MIAEAMIVSACALFNRLRGLSLVEDFELKYPHQKVPLKYRLFDAVTDKGFTSCYVGASAGLYAASEGYDQWLSIIIACIVLVGVWFWAALGWGKYNSAYDGLRKLAEKEVAWIDWLGESLVKGDTLARNRLRGTIQFSLRGLYLAPLFITLHIFIGSPLWIAALSVMQGPIYGAMRWLPDYTHRGTPIAEDIKGAWIGGMLALAVGS